MSFTTCERNQTEAKLKVRAKGTVPLRFLQKGMLNRTAAFLSQDRKHIRHPLLKGWARNGAGGAVDLPAEEQVRCWSPSGLVLEGSNSNQTDCDRTATFGERKNHQTYYQQ